MKKTWSYYFAWLTDSGHPTSREWLPPQVKFAFIAGMISEDV